MWQNFLQSATSSYPNSSAATGWKAEEALTVNEVSDQLRHCEDNLSSLQACISAVERLSEKSEDLFKKLFEKLCMSINCF